jgi:hypothetical protein
MCHVFIPANATLHGQPSPLQRMCTPQIPVGVWERFPIYLTIIPNVQRINPGSRLATPKQRHVGDIHLWTRMYASRELQRGFVPWFLNVLLRQSVLQEVRVGA